MSGKRWYYVSHLLDHGHLNKIRRNTPVIRYLIIVASFLISKPKPISASVKMQNKIFI